MQEGINLLDKPEGFPVFQVLVAGELESRDKRAVWIDTKNESSTYALSSCGGPEILEKVEIGRAFTPFQHHTLVGKLEKFIKPETEVLVLPNITMLYIDGQISDWEAEELFSETWNSVQTFQREYGLKVLVSLPRKESNLDYMVKKQSKSKIKVEKTSEGLKYDSEDFKQMSYSRSDGNQTTFSLWSDKTREEQKIKAKTV